MKISFSKIAEDFDDDLDLLREIVIRGHKDIHQLRYAPSAWIEHKLRNASINSATLLLAATFEDFIRNMAEDYISHVVQNADSVSKLPDGILNTVWNKVFSNFKHDECSGKTRVENFEKHIEDAQSQINNLLEFIKGDAAKKIFKQAIHNRNHLRFNEIDNKFKICGLDGVCRKVCEQKDLRDFFNAVSGEDAYEQSNLALGKFFKHRNDIAHALDPNKSRGVKMFNGDVDFFKAFSKSLCKTLEDEIASKQL